ncbi:uncharacterized protein LOC109712565 [Ananas comosus]|uniref:Uncharacterized protein LOC109712565 n=1 Tax=Ananas comosus TaxID=4615 RepID=A0A6P5FEE6_ANACO|nr:uncharacterized protein LOC109712565 [Ananas comosus]
MGMASNILRSSINAFCKSYHSFTSIAALLAFPFSASILFSESLIPFSPSILNTISVRLRVMFQAAGFPPFFSFLNLKLAQTGFTFIATLPFALTFLLFAKASIISIFREYPRSQLTPPSFSNLFPLYRSLVKTHLLSSFIILSSNATVFSLLFLLFNAVDIIGISSDTFLLFISVGGVLLYSTVIAIATVICNLAVIVSAMEDCGAYSAVLKGCMLIKGRVATALALALPANLGMAMAEALFQFRLVNQHRHSIKFNLSVIWEGCSIAYIHALFVVLEIIISCIFFKSCKVDYCLNWSERRELEPEEKGDLRV